MAPHASSSDSPEADWSSVDGLAQVKAHYASLIDGWQEPVAYGLALDDEFAHVNGPGGAHGLPAVLLAYVLGHDGRTASLDVDERQLADAIHLLAPAEACVETDHPNLADWRRIHALADGRGVTAVFVRHLDDPVTSVADAGLRQALPDQPTLTDSIVTSSLGAPSPGRLCVDQPFLAHPASTVATAASSTCPNTAYAGGSSLSAYTMKNWLPLVSGPALAIARVPAP